MCLAIPGKIKEINGRQAVIEYPMETRKVFMDEGIPVKEGDYVMVQMGVIVKKITKEDAKASTDAWNKI